MCFEFVVLQEAYSSYVKDYYLGIFGASVKTYDQQHLKNTTVSDASGKLPL